MYGFRLNKEPQLLAVSRMIQSKNTGQDRIKCVTHFHCLLVAHYDDGDILASWHELLHETLVMNLL
jgi:hypothetical protein